MFVIGSCVACHVMLTFNPHFVPSITVKGSREPICPRCHAKWNKIHGKSEVIHPQAYEPEPV